MFNHAYSNVIRTFVCTVGAVAVSSVFLFAAAGPAQASTNEIVSASHIELAGSSSTARPIAY